MLEMLGAIIAPINSWLYYPILIILLLGVGIYFTVRSGFVQIRLLREAFKVAAEKPIKEGDVSAFQTLMVTTASRVGTGNIVGVEGIKGLRKTTEGRKAPCFPCSRYRDAGKAGFLGLKSTHYKCFLVPSKNSSF